MIRYKKAADLAKTIKDASKDYFSEFKNPGYKNLPPEDEVYLIKEFAGIYKDVRLGDTDSIPSSCINFITCILNKDEIMRRKTAIEKFMKWCYENRYMKYNDYFMYLCSYI